MTTNPTADPRASPLIRVDEGPRGSKTLRLAMEIAGARLPEPLGDAPCWIVTQEGTFILPQTVKLKTAELIALIRAAAASDDAGR